MRIDFKYAVVQFDNSEFSVVPIIWLVEPNYCYWPEGLKNIRTAIIRELAVKEHWHKYKCHIFSKHDTYESALKAEKEAVASSESEHGVRIGKRKIRYNKFEDYVDPGPPKLILSQKKFDTSNIAGSSGESSQTSMSVTSDVEDTDDSITLTDNNINHIPIIIEEENNNVLIQMNNLKVMMKSIQTEIESMKNKQEKSLLQIQETTTVILSKINSAQYYKEDATVRDKIGKYFPLTSIEYFLELEDVLKEDQEAFTQVINRVLLIGGKNERNFVKRTLTTIFTDDVASMCSWTGQKNNFKIGDTYTMTAIKKAFTAAYPRNTEKEFENYVMEWFRFANVRKKNASEKNKTI